MGSTADAFTAGKYPDAMPTTKQASTPPITQSHGW